MADLRHSTDGPSPLSEEGYDASLLPDFDKEFLSAEHLQAFANALVAPEPSPSTEDLLLRPGNRTQSQPRGSFDTSRRRSVVGVGGEGSKSRDSLFITAQNDWAPVNPTRLGGKTKRRGGEKGKGRRKKNRSSDETREGYLYTLLKWPLLGIVTAWVSGLGISYLLTRLYIWLYEHFVAWRGQRQNLRRKLQATTNYGDWVKAAKELDTFLGNDRWKEVDEYAYYDSKTVKRVLDQIRRCRRQVEEGLRNHQNGHTESSSRAIEDLKALIEACVKNNFVGVENSRLYSQTYYGTKNLVQEFTDEGMLCSAFVNMWSAKLTASQWRRASLCLSTRTNWKQRKSGLFSSACIRTSDEQHCVCLVGARLRTTISESSKLC